MGFPRPGIRTKLRKAGRDLADARHRRALRRLGRGQVAEYRRYLDIQLRRTLGKRANDPGVGLRFLVARTAAQVESRPTSSVLCVGCRNGLELDEFRARGFADVVGIDLVSQRPDILVMDMHRLEFADDFFDVVYASHSLEHSYDLARVVAEIQRVGREGAIVSLEVPVRGSASLADRIVFSGLDELRDAFSGMVGDELLAEERAPLTTTNGQGTEIARMIFTLRKPAAAERTAAPVARAGARRRRRVRAGYALVAALTIAVLLFGALPEALGDWPYNAFGKDSRARPSNVTPPQSIGVDRRIATRAPAHT